MNHFIKKLPISMFLLTSLFFFSSLSFAEPANLSLVKKEIKNYHDSGLYEKELTEAIVKAQEYIIQQAVLNQKSKKPQKLALVLDIDETSLTNYGNMVKKDFTGTQEQFHQENLAAKTPVIKPMLALYQQAQAHGVKVFFVTGRPESERQATRLNLNKAGYRHWAGLYLKPEHYAQSSIVPFKSQTRQLIHQKGYTIVASIGDQYSDIKGGFAQRGFKLPNPYYYLP